MEVRIYTDDDAVLFIKMLDEEKICYTKETAEEEDKRPVMIFRTIGDVSDLVEKLRKESPCACLYYFDINYLDEDGYVIEKDKFTAQVMDTCSGYENREAADDLVEAYCQEQIIHYDGAEDWETKLVDVC
jgi:hypothetical protein